MSSEDVLGRMEWLQNKAKKRKFKIKLKSRRSMVLFHGYLYMLKNGAPLNVQWSSTEIETTELH
jgi:hypothetical protein